MPEIEPPNGKGSDAVLRTLLLGAIVAGACATGRSLMQEPPLRDAVGTPAQFLVVGSARPARDASCRSPLEDPRDGTRLPMERSAFGVADYVMSPGLYGVREVNASGYDAAMVFPWVSCVGSAVHHQIFAPQCLRQVEREDDVAIKAIVELQAKPGRRAEMKSFVERMVAQHGPTLRGFLASTRYEVIDNPDMLIEIGDWESADARLAHLQESAASGLYAPLLEMLAAPFRVTIIRQLP